MFRLFAVTLIVAAVAAPSSWAMHAPGDDASSNLRAPQPSSATADQLDARLGPKYVAVPSQPTSVRVTAAPTRNRDAGRWLIPIVMVVLLTGAVSLRLRRSGKPGTAPAGLRARRL